MVEAPFFSIVIPTYNRADLIGLTLDSVLAQEFGIWELLVVDDGSKDETAAVVHPYLVDSRIQYLPKENAERGAARNYGLALAQGEYVLFLDSDDRLHPNHLATLERKIKELGQPDFIATKYDFDRDGQWRPSDLSPLSAGPLGFDAFLGGNLLACNICIRRQNSSLHTFEEDRQYAAVEDWMFMLENTQHGAAVQLVDAVTLTMNDHDQRSMRADNQGLIRRLELAAGWMEQHLTLTVKQRRRLLGRVYYLCAIHAHIDGYQAQAMRHALRAIPGLTVWDGATLLIRCAAPPALVQWAKRRMGR